MSSGDGERERFLNRDVAVVMEKARGSYGRNGLCFTAVSRKVVPEKRTGQCRKDLWVTVSYICLIEFHDVLARGKANL